MMSKLTVCLLIRLCLVSFFPSLASAEVFYVSPDGNDANSGLSPARAWKTAHRVNKIKLSAGDQVLFEGGEKFQGPVLLDREDQGSTNNPIVFGSYDGSASGPATIAAGTGIGIDVHNTSNLRISGLRIIGDGVDQNSASGIRLLSSQNDGSTDIEIENVEISGFGKYGISIGTWKSLTGYRNVRVLGSSFHGNRLAGIFTWGPWGPGIYAHSDILIRDCSAYDMKYGSGITLSSVNGGMVERCVAYENGEKVSGAVGIWAWDCNNIVFQFNESYRNRTIGVDGDGFDFDGGVTNSIMQYNYSHDNDSAGFLLAQYAYAPQAMENITIRYNISENDCQKRGYGAIHIWNNEGAERIRNVRIYQNTVYMASNPGRNVLEISNHSLPNSKAPPSTLRHGSSAIAIISRTTDVSVYNNLFVATGGRALVSVAAGQESLQFQNNAYWTESDFFHVDWNGVGYASLTEWLEAARDQERIGSRILAIHADPMLEAPGMGGTLGQADLLSTLSAYKLKKGSPLAGRGMDLKTNFGIDPGLRGFFGTPVAQSGAPSIGAHLASEPSSM